MSRLAAGLARLRAPGRERVLLIGVTSGLIGRFAALAAPFIATPVLYGYFGDASFGIWITAISITSIAVSLDLGIGSSLLTRTATAYGEDDLKAARKYIASAYGTLIAVALTLISVSTAAFLIFRSGVSFATTTDVSLFFAVVVTFLLGLPAALIHQILYAVQKIALSSALLVAGAFGGLAASVVSIHFEAPVWAVAAAYSVPPMLAGFGGAAFYFAGKPSLRPRLSDFDWARARDLLGLGSHFLLLSVLMGVSLNVDNIIIAAKAGVEAVAAYAIPARLGSILGLIIINLFMPLWGANSEAIARGHYGWVRKGTRRMSWLGVAIVILSGGAMLIAADLIMTLWVGRTFEDQGLTLAFVIAGAAVVAATSPYNMLLNALGRPDLQLWPWAAFLAVSIPLKFLLVTADRLWIAAAVTSLIYMLAITPAIMVRAQRTLNVRAAQNEDTDRIPT